MKRHYTAIVADVKATSTLLELAMLESEEGSELSPTVEAAFVARASELLAKSSDVEVAEALEAIPEGSAIAPVLRREPSHAGRGSAGESGPVVSNEGPDGTTEMSSPLPTIKPSSRDNRRRIVGRLVRVGGKVTGISDLRRR